MIGQHFSDYRFKLLGETNRFSWTGLLAVGPGNYLDASQDSICFTLSLNHPNLLASGPGRLEQQKWCQSEEERRQLLRTLGPWELHTTAVRTHTHSLFYKSSYSGQTMSGQDFLCRTERVRQHAPHVRVVSCTHTLVGPGLQNLSLVCVCVCVCFASNSSEPTSKSILKFGSQWHSSGSGGKS